MESCDYLSDVSEEETVGCYMRKKVKSLEKDEPASPFLASIIDRACTSKCDTEDLVKKYKIPKNCDKLCSPVVNSEIWEMLDNRTQTFDKGFQDIQNLVAVSLIPVIKMAEILKEHIMADNEAPSLLSDIMTLMCQVQHRLSLRRRFQIRPCLNPRFKKLCGGNTPVTSYLFGDNLRNDMKECLQPPRKVQPTNRGMSTGRGKPTGRGNPTVRRKPTGRGYQSARGRLLGSGKLTGRGKQTGRGNPRGARQGVGDRYNPYTHPSSSGRQPYNSYTHQDHTLSDSERQSGDQTWHRPNSNTVPHTVNDWKPINVYPDQGVQETFHTDSESCLVGGRTHDKIFYS